MKIRLGRRFTFHIDGCRLGFMSLRTGQYKAWWFQYASGWKVMKSGKWRKLWCFPHFKFVDTNSVIEKIWRDDAKV